MTVEHDRTSTTIVTASKLGDEVHATVLRDGEPVRGAEIELRGFADRRGNSFVRVATSGEDGTFVLRGIPPGAPGVALAVLHRGSYRRVYVPRERFDDARIDLDQEALLPR